jgi:hypothetical protein
LSSRATAWGSTIEAPAFAQEQQRPVFASHLQAQHRSGRAGRVGGGTFPIAVLSSSKQGKIQKGVMMSEVAHGACLCGGIEFDVHEPEVLGSCYCTRCQRWTGSSSATVVVVAAENFKVTKGQDLLKQYHEEGFGDRYFCSHCGSGVYADGGEKYYVGTGVLRDVKLEPAFHIQVANKPPWHEIGDSAPQFPEWAPS